MIIDTDVLIWSMRGNLRAAQAIQENSPFSITWITYLELLQGARSRAEQNKIVAEINRLEVTVLHATQEQSALAITVFRDYHLSSSLDIADAINAAQAMSTGQALLSSNKKHYGSIKELRYKVFKP